MSGPKSRKTSKNRIEALNAKLDGILHLLEDIFILQATNAGMGREDIREILGVRTARISQIKGGIRPALSR